MEHSSWLERWGRLVAGPKTRWLTLVLWVVVVVVFSIAAPAVNKEENDSAALLPSTSASVQAAAQVKRAFPNDTGTPALLVWYRNGGLTASDLAAVQKVSQDLTDHPLAEQTSVAPFYKWPTASLSSVESKDGTTLVLPVTFQSDASSTELKQALASLPAVVQAATGSNPFADASLATSGLHVRITGPVGIAADALDLFQNADFTLLAATTLLVLVLLILLYRSPILAFVPLVCVGFAYGLISPLLGILAKSGLITVDSQSISIMTVLLFGAGTDYCLFLVARFRERLYQVGDKYQALREAVGGASGAIAMSGLTVVLSLLTLLLAKYGSDHRFAVPFSLSIFIMALAGITLLPALLSIFGRVAFFPFVPRTREMWAARAEKGKRVNARRQSKQGEPGAVSRWVGQIVTRRPWLVVTTGVVVLALLASFSSQIKTTYNLLSSFPQNMPSRQGFTLLADHFTPGTLAPVQVLVDTQQASDLIRQDLKALSFVQDVSQPSISEVRPGFTLYSVTLGQDPYSNEAMQDIPIIRQTVEQSLTQSGVTTSSDSVWIAGETATQLDTQTLTQHDTDIVIPVVIAMIAILLLIYLRSIVAMLYLIGTVLLSYFSALGLGWMILHNLMGASAIQGLIPLYAFVFLVALGEDYNIFMISRIWQAARRQVPLKQAIREGVSTTSGVITSAGLILAGTFAVLASLPIQVLVQFGIITALGVLLDTFVVRPFLVPAITAILGRVAFWPSQNNKAPE